MRPIAVIGSAVLGGVAGYLAGTYVACDWLYPGSNLCGLVGVFITGPIGFVAGGIGGWLGPRRRGE